MTAIVGVFERPADADAVARRVLDAMRRRGADDAAVWANGAGCLGVARWAWEGGAGLAGRAAVVREGALTVVADASLYYRRDLVAALRDAGETPGGPGAGHYILAAYRAWGERCAERWRATSPSCSGTAGRAARSPRATSAASAPLLRRGGPRPARRLDHRRRRAGCPTPPALDLATVAADAAGLFAADAATCYEGVCRLGAGYTLVYAAGATRVTRHWTPPSARWRSRRPSTTRRRSCGRCSKPRPASASARPRRACG
jgi:hypothetical protein